MSEMDGLGTVTLPPAENAAIIPNPNRALPMRALIDDLNTRVVVRRVAIGPAPFAWEVHRGNNIPPVHVTCDRFRNMEAAHSAGQARLGEFLTTKSAKQESGAARSLGVAPWSA
jgi:hypothetical protein